jgi:hypothetical protein
MDYQALDSENPFAGLDEVVQMVKAEAPEIVPGTVTLDPEYDLDGKVEIIEENSEAFYSYFADAFYRINKDYFTNLGITNSADAEKYMEENILPAGFMFPVKTQAFAYSLTKSTIGIDLKVLTVRLITYDQYVHMNMTTKGLVSAYYDGYQVDNGADFNAILLGFDLIPSEDNISSKMVLDVIQGNKETGAKLGFPDLSGSLNSEKLLQLDNYLRAMVYAIRGCDYEEPTSFLKDTLNPVVADSTLYHKLSSDSKIFSFVNMVGVINKLDINVPPNDFPLEILKVANQKYSN